MRTSSLFLSGLLTAAAAFSLSSTGAQAIETGGAVWRIPNAIHSTAKAQRSMESPISKEVVDYSSKYSKGTIVVNTEERRLYYVLGDGKAIKYGIGVGRPGFTWSGTHTVTRKAEWPGWTPPPRMRTRQPDLPYHMAGGPDNPLGARAMYIGSTIYRIHGTAEPWTIGQAVSSGCIRMANNDVVDLYERVNVGTRVVVEH